MKKKNKSNKKKRKYQHPSSTKKPSQRSQILRWTGVIVFITGLVAFMANSGNIISVMPLLRPVLTITYSSDSSNPLNVSFLFKNEGHTTLKNVQVATRVVAEIPGSAFIIAMAPSPSENELLFLGDIPPQKSAGARLPLDLQNTLPWEIVKVCMVTSFQNDFYRIHINQGTDTQSFLFDKRQGVVNWLPRRECLPDLPPPHNWDFSRKGIKHLVDPYLTPRR